jgi:hypothetical protein
MGVIDDTPKPANETNFVNTAHRFLQQFPFASSITGVKERLVYGFSILLQATVSRYEINTEEFDRYATDTVKLHPALFVVLYAGY